MVPIIYNPYVPINCIPITEDGRCVFGLRVSHIFASDNMLGLIGGVANKDEMPITSLGDVQRFMHMEMQEETNLVYDERTIDLFGLHHYRGKYEFLYTIRLPITAEHLANYQTSGEFVQLIGLTPEETETTEVCWVDAFQFHRGHLRDMVGKSGPGGPM
jgi:hypothetical protein